MRSPYGQSSNAQQQMMASQQALASLQVPQQNNSVMQTILPLIANAFENMPKDNKDKKLPTPTPKGQDKNPKDSIATVLGKIFNKNSGGGISNPNRPNFMNY